MHVYYINEGLRSPRGSSPISLSHFSAWVIQVPIIDLSNHRLPSLRRAQRRLLTPRQLILIPPASFNLPTSFGVHGFRDTRCVPRHTALFLDHTMTVYSGHNRGPQARPGPWDRASIHQRQPSNDKRCCGAQTRARQIFAHRPYAAAFRRP